jgi:hypothetical protein
MVLRKHGWQGKVPPGGNPVAGSVPSLLMSSDAAVSKMSMGDVGKAKTSSITIRCFKP